MRVDETQAGVPCPEPKDPRVALVLDRLCGPEIHLLLLFPSGGEPVPSLPPGADSIVRDLLDLELVDPSGMVSFRVQLVEPAPAGLRLSRLGRTVAATIRARA